MHGLRRELLEAQAQAVGIPIQTIELPEEPSMEEYNQLMNKRLLQLKQEGYTQCAFGDIFLDDLRFYRENQLQDFGISSLFPLWKKNTGELLNQFINLGFKAVVVCVNAELLDESFVGREVNSSFLKDLPINVDPCGENGEFHTFCYDGPLFKKEVPFEIGERIYRSYPNPKNENSDAEDAIGFWFCDLLLPPS